MKKFSNKLNLGFVEDIQSTSPKLILLFSRQYLIDSTGNPA